MNSPTKGEEAARLKRQGSEQAIQLALEGKWEEAATLNRSLIQLHPADVDAWNRLGKSLLELGRFREARDSYAKSLDLDPINQIAKRNLDRLQSLNEDDETRRPEGGARVAQDLFIEEVGKTGVSLLHGATRETLARLTAGDEGFLKPGTALIDVEDATGEVIGSIEPKLALRLSRLMEGGNKYAAAIKTVSDRDAEVIIKETYRDPSQTRLSFPATTDGTGVRPYIKESLLRYAGDEDDDDDAEETEQEDWDGEPESSAEPTVSFSSFQNTIERDDDVEEEEE